MFFGTADSTNLPTHRAIIYERADSMFSSLANDVSRALVFADSEKRWMAEVSIARPLAELYLDVGLRLHPVRARCFRGFGLGRESALFLLDAIELRAQLRENV